MPAHFNFDGLFPSWVQRWIARWQRHGTAVTFAAKLLAFMAWSLAVYYAGAILAERAGK